MKIHPLLSPEAMKDHLSAPIRGASDQEVSTVHAAAGQLADAAYRHGDHEAWQSAERILYVIHVDSHFAPPSQVLPCVIWSTLVSAKLQALLAADVPARVTFDELLKRLQALIDEQERRNHSFADEVTAAPGLQGIRMYTKNWFGVAHGFTNQLIGIAQRLSIPSRKLVLANLSDETSKEDHQLLRQRWLDAIGVVYHDDPVRNLSDPEYLVETSSVLNYRTAVCCLHDPAYALGSVHLIEATLIQNYYQRLVDGLRRRGFDEHSLEVFWLHAELDEDHAAEWLETIRAEKTLDEAGYARVLAGAVAGGRVRSEWFDAMRRKCREAS
jgi:hypothetical protein